MKTRHFDFDPGVSQRDAIASIATALDDEGLALLVGAHVRRGRVTTIRQRDEAGYVVDRFVVPASLIMERPR